MLSRCAERCPTYDGGFDRAEAAMQRVDRAARVGAGEPCFTQAGRAVDGWVLQRRAGLRVTASAPCAEAGVDVVLGLPAGPVQLLVPCRVTAVLDERRRRGFAYSTLPGHPERGLEEFTIEWRQDDSVWLHIRAVSAPGSWLTRLGGPIGPLVQRVVTERYLAALRS